VVDVYKPEIFRGFHGHWFVGWYGVHPRTGKRPGRHAVRQCTFRLAIEYLDMLYALGWVVRDGR
jgi:hypothetical protein